MNREMIAFVANFADENIIIPLSVLVFLFLLRNANIARAWAISIVTLLGTLITAKIIGYTIEHHIPSFIHARSISAHTAAGAAVYGGIVTMLCKRKKFSVPLAFVSSLSFALLFGTAKYLHRDHTITEVIAGAFLGTGLCTLFTLYINKQARTTFRFNRSAVIFSCLILITLLHGHLSNGEQVIHDIGNDIREKIKNG